MADLELTVLQRASDDLGFIAGLAITEQLIIAAGGTSSHGPTIIASSNARHFESRTTPRQLGLRDVLAVGDALWTCGEYGQLAVSHDLGGSWKLFDTGTDQCLFALALAADGAIWVSGMNGYAARVVGEQLERVELQTTARLESVYAVRDEVAVLGDDGMIYRWRAGEVIKVATGATKPLTALVISKLGTWIAVGDGGFVARSPDGKWFSRVTSGVEIDLEAVASFADGRIVTVGDRGIILVSNDDGRVWKTIETDLTAHLWAVEQFGHGVLIGGDDGLLVKLAAPGDQTWQDRINTFGGVKPLDVVFASGPDGFIVKGLVAYLDAIEGAGDEDDASKARHSHAHSHGHPHSHGHDHDHDHDHDNDHDNDHDHDHDHDHADEHDDEDAEPKEAGPTDREAFEALSQPGAPEDFERNYGATMPTEVAKFLTAVDGRNKSSSFEELRLDNDLLPDVGHNNLFELIVRRDQHAYLGTGIVEAFCGVFCIGSQGNGDTYHMELYEWDGPRQVLHYDHETHAFTGVLADSLDSLTYLAALKRANDKRKISQEAFEIGLRKLRGKVAPTWHFSIDEDDPDFVALDPKRRDTEFFFYRTRWICALLKHDGVTEVSDIPRLFMADFNQVVPQDQLAARFEACEKFIPTALYSIWRAYLFDEPELARYLEIGRRHKSRLVRDATKLVDELRAGRNELGTIKDMRAYLAAFRALDLDPRRAEQRKAEAEARAKADASRRAEVDAELARTPRPGWRDLAWRWLGDGVAHRALLEKLDDTPELVAQIAALDELRKLDEDDREITLPRIAAELSAELEAVLVGSLVRGDRLEGVLRDVDPTHGDGGVGEDDADEDDADEDDDDDGEDDDANAAAAAADDSRPDPERVRQALAMTQRALRLAPDDDDTQFTHAMLLLDGDRVGVVGSLDKLLRDLPRFTVSNRINIAVRLGKMAHERFGDVLDVALGDASSYGDVADELFTALGDAVLAHAPDKMVKLAPLLPAQVNLLATLASKAVEAGQRDQAIALYERLLELPIPDEGGERMNYLRALNNACVQAHAAKAHAIAVRIADRAQPVAQENPYIYHAAACAYAAVGDYAKALHQIRRAIENDYDHLEKVEVDPDLGPLLELPEFKALFRDWHTRQEGN